MLVLASISKTRGAVGMRSALGIECCLTLWVARAPEQEPLRRVARGLEQSLDQDVRDIIARLDSTLPGWPLRALNWFHARPMRDFDAALRCLENEPVSELASELATLPTVHGCTATRTPPGLASSGGGRRFGNRRLVRVVGDILVVLLAIARSPFVTTWKRQQERLEMICTRLTPRLDDTVTDTLCGLSPRCVYERDADRLIFVGGQSTSVVDCSRLPALEIVPSLWLRRRVVVGYGHRGIAVCVGVPTRRNSAARSPDDVPNLLGILADVRRFEILRLCMGRARSTTELASLLRVTPGPICRHLKKLEAHGFVVGQRFGREVTYAAVPELTTLLAEELMRLPEQAVGRTDIDDVTGEARP